MNANSSNVYEAYVIEDDGTKTAVPIRFADNHTTSDARKATRGFRPAGHAAYSAAGYAAQSPYTNVDPTTTAPRRSLHLGRRLAGVGVALVGVPLLILPGPGLALIGLGLLMVVMP